MFKELNSYAGLFAKVQVMKRGLLKAEDYDNLISKSSVYEIASYLNNNTGYSSVLNKVNISDVHRGQLERLLRKSREESFVKLTNFISGNDKRFINLYVMQSETRLIKSALRRIAGKDIVKVNTDASLNHEGKYSFDAEKLMKAENIRAFKEAIADAPFYDLIEPFLTENPDAFKIEMLLDEYFFKTQWKAIGKLIGKADKVTVERAFGSNIDMINIMWILRAKKYLNLSNELIIAHIIPVHYRLKKDKIFEMIYAPDGETAQKILQDTAYKHITFESEFPMENIQRETMVRILKSLARSHPFSILSVVCYIYMKDIEISNIIAVVESIRYNVNKDEIKKYLIGIGGDRSGY